MTLTRLTGAIGTCTLFLFAATVFSAPVLQINPDDFNFGFAPQHASISHGFWLKSTGTDTLKILKVVPGCGCTKAPLDKTELPPGDSTRLEVIFSTRSYTNNVRKSPSISTNEGSEVHRVSIYANIVTRPDSTYPLTVSPYKLDLSQFGDKVRDRMEFTIENVSDADLKITLVDQPAGIATTELPDEVKAGEKATAVIKLSPEALEQSFDKSITIQVNDDKLSRFTIPVKRTYKAPQHAEAADKGK